MTTKEIIEGDKSLAKFMNIKWDIENPYGRKGLFVFDSNFEELAYQINYREWNQLVPVVQKIFSLPIEETNPLVFQLADLNMAWNRKGIAEIWESCVRFVIKYQDVKGGINKRNDKLS